MISLAELYALLQVVLVDLVLAGDNAIVVGMVAAGLPETMRVRVIMLGIAGATLMRVAFAVVTVELLQVLGLTLAGGLLLLWVCWKLWRELMERREALLHQASNPGSTGHSPLEAKTYRQAVLQIVLADVSMSLDNVLAVAGVARDHAWVLAFGLALSVGFMAVAANLIAGLLNRHHWIAYVGLAIIFYVACTMIWEGSLDVLQAAEVIARASLAYSRLA